MKWRVCCMNCRSPLSESAQMGDFVGLRGGRRGALSGRGGGVWVVGAVHEGFGRDGVSISVAEG